MHSIKFSSTKIITLNNTKFIPHKLHQLPKNYKGFCYISSDEINWNQDKENRLTSNHILGGLATR